MARRRVDPFWVVALTLLLAGSFLRLRDVTGQCLGGDELHAVRAAARLSFAEAFTSHQEKDSSIPLTLYAKVLMETVGLDELALRLPAIASGLLLLLTPLLLARRLGVDVALVAVGLFATSPILVYYSYVARPYGPATLLTVLALVSWDRWIRRRGGLLPFVACSALAGFFHLFALVPVVVLLAVALMAVRSGAVPLREAVKAIALVALSLLLLLGPGLPELLRVQLQKAGEAEPALGLVSQTWLVLSGYAYGPALALLVLIPIGALALWRGRGLLAIAVVAAVVAQVVALWLARPVSYPVAWARYFVPVWPLALLLAAAGVEALLGAREGVRDRRLAIGIAGIVLSTLALWFGFPGRAGKVRGWLSVVWPLLLLLAVVGTKVALSAALGARLRERWTGSRRRRLDEAAVVVAGLLFALGQPLLGRIRLWTREVDSFRSAPDVLLRETPPMGEAPEAYRRVAADPSPEVLELPPVMSWIEWGLYAGYQRLHGKHVRLASTSLRRWREQGIHHRNVVDLGEERAVARSRARYLVVHLGFVSELATRTGFGVDRPMNVEIGERTRTFLRDRFGPPVVEDEGVALYDLTR